MMAAEKQRILYPDLLRIISSFLVVLLHVSTKNMWAVQPGEYEFWCFFAYQILTRFAGPIFFMVSGMFMLSPEKTMTTRAIWKKYLWRIAKAFVVWSLVYASVTVFTAWDYSRETVAERLWTNFYQGPYHFWFLFMLGGIYVLLPMLRKAVAASSQADLLYFMGTCFVFSVVPSTLKALGRFESVIYVLDSMGISSACVYIGFYVLGYYFQRYPLSRTKRRMVYGLSALGFASMCVLSALDSLRIGEFSVAWQTNSSFGVVLQTAAVFLLVQSLEDRLQGLSIRLRKLILLVSECSFGIYLCHDLFITALYLRGIQTLNYDPLWSSPAITVAVYLMSACLIYIVRKVPWLRSLT